MKFRKGNRWRGSKGELRYKTWRKNVFELNFRKQGLSKYYVCTKCNKKRKTTRVLHAHHIFSWHNYPKLRYEMKNGIVLCKYCHNKFHRQYGYKSTEEPKLLVEYLGKSKSTSVEKYIEQNNK